jgi:hypothetical protein
MTRLADALRVAVSSDAAAATTASPAAAHAADSGKLHVRPAMPPPRVVPHLSRLRGPQQQRRYNIVVAAYALGELSSAVRALAAAYSARLQRCMRHLRASLTTVRLSCVSPHTQVARQETVQRLWAHCADVLVIVEPGTPIGSAAVREARTAVLRVEARRQRAAGKHQAARAVAMEEPADEADAGQRVEAAGDVTADASLAGVHIVAPCAHEQRCPMDGTAQWCHFVQRVQRPAAHRAIKGGAPARTYQARGGTLPRAYAKSSSRF